MPRRADPKSISFLIGTLNAGGIQASTLRLAKEFVRHGYETSLVVVDGSGPMRAGIPPGCEFVDLGCRRIRRGLLPLARHWRRRKPRLVISAQTNINILAVVARALSGSPKQLIITERNPLDPLLKYEPMLRTRLRILLVRLCYPFASQIVAVSEDVAGSLKRVAGLGREIQVIHNGIDIEEVRSRAAESALHPWLGQTGQKLILGIGRLSPQKNFALLFRAFARLSENTRLLIFGEGPQRASLQALAEELGIGGRFELAGLTTNPFRFLARCDVFVLSSRWEGFANVVLEAMACGAPIVATDCGGPADILRNGRLGRVVPVDDVEAMAAAIQDVLRYPPDKAALVEQARKYSIQNTAAQYEAISASPG